MGTRTQSPRTEENVSPEPQWMSGTKTALTLLTLLLLLVAMVGFPLAAIAYP